MKADSYLYLMDTGLVGACFPQVFEELQPEPDQLFIPRRHQGDGYSNIVTFGKGVVKRYATKFDKKVMKMDTLSLERGKAAGIVRPIKEFGRLRPMPERWGYCEYVRAEVVYRTRLRSSAAFSGTGTSTITSSSMIGQMATARAKTRS